MLFWFPDVRKPVFRRQKRGLRNVNFKISRCQDFLPSGRLFAVARDLPDARSGQKERAGMSACRCRAEFCLSCGAAFCQAGLPTLLFKVYFSAFTSMAFQSTAAIAAPSSGAAMNTQSSARALPPSNRAGPIERAGLTDVPV